MKVLPTVAAVVAFLQLAVSVNRLQAGDGTPAGGSGAVAKAAHVQVAAATAANANALSASAERELWEQIQKAWRKREERLPSLLLVYIINIQDDHLRDRQRLMQARHNRIAAPVKDAAKGDPQAGKDGAPAAGPAHLSSVHLFAARQNRIRTEYWQRPTEQKARAVLANLAPGKDSDFAAIDDGDRTSSLTANAHDTAGNHFRQIGILARQNWIASTTIGQLLLLDYRSSLAAANGVFPRATPRLSVVPQKGDQPRRVIVSLPRREIWLDPSRDFLVTEIDTWRAARSDKITRTVCEYEKAPAPLDWVPKKFSTTWFPASVLGNRVDDCVTVDWGTGDDQVPNALFEFDYPDGTYVLDQTEDNGQTTKASIVWNGKLVPASVFRPYSKNLERIKKGQPADKK